MMSEDDTAQRERRKGGKKRGHRRPTPVPLEQEDFYHGLLPREDAKKMLRKNGDFLVRYTEVPPDNIKSYVISIMCNDKPKHFVIKEKDNKYTVDYQQFDSIGELVRTYWEKGIGLSNDNMNTILKRPVLKEQWQLRHNQIRLDKKLGGGAFGEVYSGILTLDRGHTVPVAVKKSHAKGMSKKELQEIMKESRLMRQYDHPNVVKLYGVAVEQEPVLIVMELITGGSLDKFVNRHAKLLGSDMLFKFCLDAAKGLEYLHSKNCIHRDVAARNCLINDCHVVKISDFGLSQEGKSAKMVSRQKAPIRWLSVETLTESIYTAKSDVWAYGVLVWEVFSEGAVPYAVMNLLQVAQAVRGGHRMSPPSHMPEVLRVVMSSCWETNPEQRPSFAQIVTSLSPLSDRVSPQSVTPPTPSGN